MVDRVAIGNLGSFGYGMRISRPGFAWDDTTKGNISFATDFGHSALIHARGTLVRGNSASFATLDYVPMIDWVVYDSGTTQIRPKYITSGTGPDSGGFFYSYLEPKIKITSSSIEFQNFSPYSSSFTIKWIVYAMPGG